VKPLVEKYFGPIPRGPEPAPVTAKTEPHTREIRETMRDQVAAREGPDRIRGTGPLEHPAAALLMRILAGGKSSRLHHDSSTRRRSPGRERHLDPAMQLGGSSRSPRRCRPGTRPRKSWPPRDE